MAHKSESSQQRCGPDRRKRKIPPLKYLLFGGRRKNIRRKEDRKRLIIVDTYSPWVSACVLIILVLSLADGFFTLYFTGNGANETNPIMGRILEFSPWAFIFVKYFLTSVGLICLLIINNLYIRPLSMRVGNMFPALIVVYMMVISWHLILKFS
jgi:hypothetical protein